MRAELRRLHSPDVHDLPSFIPEVHDNFGFLLQMVIGTLGAKGEESFDVMVCTPLWLMSQYKGGGMVIGRHHLIVFEYDYKRLYEFVIRTCEKTTGET